MCNPLGQLYQNIETCLKSVSTKYGEFVKKFTVLVIVAPCLIVFLGFGLIEMKTESVVEHQYTPIPSTASKNRDQVRSMFDIDIDNNFYRQSLPDSGYYVSVIIERIDGENILDNAQWSATVETELKSIYSRVNSTVLTVSGMSYKYSGICAKLSSACVVEGELIFSQAFKNDLQAGSIAYPKYTYLGETVYIDKIVGDVKIDAASNSITSATALKLTFNLESNRSDISRNWEREFIKNASYSGTNLRFKYAYSDSLSDEKTKLVENDQKKWIPCMYVFKIVFSVISLMTGNCIANRFNLGFAGILGIAIAILGSVGLITVCGVPFNDIAGAMSFPVLSIGITHMHILLSCLANNERNENFKVADNIAYIMRTGGMSITITSTIYVIVYFAGASSNFPNVRHVALYTGCAYLFCWLLFVTYFIGCITMNEKRISKTLHCCCCFHATSEEETNVCCSGILPGKRYDFEGHIEKLLKKILKTIISNRPSQVIIFLIFLICFSVAIWGTTEFKNDLDIRDLVGKDSYYYDYYDTDQRKFSQSLIVSLNFNGKIDYRLDATFNQIDSLITDVKAHNQTIDDFLISWIHSYRSAPSYTNSSDAAFVAGLQTYLTTTEGTKFVNDVTIDTNDDSISASRLHIRTSSLKSPSDQAVMMKEIRKIVDSASLPVFVYAPEFVFLEQYVEIRKETILSLAAIGLVVIFLVTTVFMFCFPLIVLLVTLNAIIIMVEVIGFAHFWGLTLNSITLVPLFLCVGFCIEFSLHICHAVVKASGNDWEKCVKEAIGIAGGPIFIGTVSSLIGVLFLAGSSSYIFFSFFKIMVLVLLCGLFQSLFLLPIVLEFIRPNFNVENLNQRRTSNETENVEMVAQKK